MDPIDFGGQRSKVKVTMGIYANKLLNTRDLTVAFFFITLGRHVNYDERIEPFDFEVIGQGHNGYIWK